MSKNKITNDEAWREIENNPRKKWKQLKSTIKNWRKSTCHYFAICRSTHFVTAEVCKCIILVNIGRWKYSGEFRRQMWKNTS